MQNISKELKEAFLTDSKHKTLTLRHPVTDFSRVNFWNHFNQSEGTIHGQSFWGHDLNLLCMCERVNDSDIEVPLMYSAYASRCVVSYKVRINQWSSDVTPGYIRPRILLHKPGQSTSVVGDYIPFSEARNSFQDASILVKNLDGEAVLIAVELRFYDEEKHMYRYGEATADIDIQWQRVAVCYGGPELIKAYPNTVQVELLGYDFNYFIPKLYPLNTGEVTNSAIVKESASFYENISPEENFTYGGCTSVAFNVNLMNNDSFAVNDYVQASIKIDDVDDEVPLGIFKVYDTETSGSHNLIEKRIEAYDDMICFNRDATNWWSNYVYAFSTSDQVGEGINCVRQMFSTFYNVMKNTGLNIDYYFTSVRTVPFEYEWSEMTVKYYFDPSNTNEYILYKRIEFEWDYNEHFYRINVRKNNDYMSQVKELLEDPMTQQNSTKRYNDPRNSPAGNILIGQGETSHQYIIVNDGDIFKWANGFEVYIPYRYVFRYNGVERSEDLNIDVTTIECTEYTFDLFDTPNDLIRLVYYNWETKEISNPSSVTFRDVVRSLIELTGGFLRYGRNGLLEWIRPQTEFLYPSLTRYPSESLYPIKGPSAQIDNSQIRSYKKKGIDGGLYGGIDIIAGLNSLGENNVALSYTEDESKPNRYVIDENVFYAQDGVNYAKTFDGVDVIPEATQMLENLYSMIQGFSFAPYEAKVRGMPWIESGDRIMIKTGEGYFGSFIYERYLSGIQLLVDDYETTAEN